MAKSKIQMNGVNGNKLTLEAARDKYLQYCKAKGLTKDTLKNYKNAITGLVNYLGADFNLYDLNDDDLIAYTNHLIDSEISGNSIRSFHKCIKAFLRYYALSIQFPTPKETFNYKETYTEDDIKKMLVVPKNSSKWVDWRDYTIVCFLLGTGVRSNTLRHIKVKDIDFDTNVIYLSKTKTHKKYFIPMSSQLKKTMREYLSKWNWNDDDFLFPNQFGDQLSQHSPKQIIMHYNKKHGIDKRGIHRFRNTFATQYIKQGGNIAYLQELLAHSDISTTRRYVSASIEDIKAVHDKFNILDNMSKKSIKLKK